MNECLSAVPSFRGVGDIIRGNSAEQLHLTLLKVPSMWPFSRNNPEALTAVDIGLTYYTFKILLQLKTWAIFKLEYQNIFNPFLDVVIEKGGVFARGDILDLRHAEKWYRL